MNIIYILIMLILIDSMPFFIINLYLEQNRYNLGIYIYEKYMAIFNIYEKHIFNLKKSNIQIFCICRFFLDSFPIRFKLFALLPCRFIADSESGKYAKYSGSSVPRQNLPTKNLTEVLDFHLSLLGGYFYQGDLD